MVEEKTTDAMDRWRREQDLRFLIKFAVAGKTDLTDEQVVDHLLSAYPRFRRSREWLAKEVTSITPLACRKGDAIDEPTPSNKRRKVDEVCNAGEQNEVLRSTSTRKCDSLISDSVDRGEVNENGEGERRGEIVDGRRERNKNWCRDIRVCDGRREPNTNGNGGWRDNRPMFRDLCGMYSVLQGLTREVIRPLHQLKLLHHLGVEPTARILLHGPRGCGKTTLARAIANEAGVPFFEISAAELMPGVSGVREEIIRELFSKAYARAPSVLLIDEIDALTSKAESVHKEIERRIVNELMSCMDEPKKLNPVNHYAGSESSNSGPRPRYVLVIGATSRPHAVVPALRRLFVREIPIGVLDEQARFYLLAKLLSNLKVKVGFDISKLSRCTVGFVGGDLVKLVEKAGILAVNRILDTRKSSLYNSQRVGVPFEDYHRQQFSDEEMENLSITVEDCVAAGMTVQPSSVIEVFCTMPNAKWDDVGGLQSLKLEFERHIIKPIKFPEVYKEFGVNFTPNFFLYGPPGCGKTLIVKALANEAGAKFIHVKGSELLKEYGDQSELVLRTIFSHARTCSPCILFLDELEAIIPYDESRPPVFSQLETELCDEQRSGLYVIAATNMPENTCHLLFGSAIGNSSKLMYVPLPSPDERGMILKALARDKPIDADVDLMALGRDVACENFSGAELFALMKDAAMTAIDRPTLHEHVPWTIRDADFRSSLKKISPSVSSAQIKLSELFATWV